MANETPVTVIGNLTADPELRFAQSGHAVASFTVASTPRTYDRQRSEWVDGDALFLNCSVWREAAENVAESLAKGMRVIVHGWLKQRSYETRDGEKRTVFEVDVQEIGPALRYATAKVTRSTRGSGDRPASQQPTANQWGQQPAAANNDPWGQQQSAAPANDPWAQQAFPSHEEPPF